MDETMSIGRMWSVPNGMVVVYWEKINEIGIELLEKDVAQVHFVVHGHWRELDEQYWSILNQRR